MILGAGRPEGGDPAADDRIAHRPFDSRRAANSRMQSLPLPLLQFAPRAIAPESLADGDLLNFPTATVL